MNYCTAVYSSLTYAIKAEKALAAAYITASVVKLDYARAKEGCTYGVEYPCSRQRHVKETLDRARIRPRRYIDGGGGDLV